MVALRGIGGPEQVGRWLVLRALLVVLLSFELIYVVLEFIVYVLDLHIPIHRLVLQVIISILDLYILFHILILHVLILNRLSLHQHF